MHEFNKLIKYPKVHVCSCFLMHTLLQRIESHGSRLEPESLQACCIKASIFWKWSKLILIENIFFPNFVILKFLKISNQSRMKAKISFCAVLLGCSISGGVVAQKLSVYKTHATYLLGQFWFLS